MREGLFGYLDELDGNPSLAAAISMYAAKIAAGERPGDDDEDIAEVIDWSQVHDPADDVVEGLVMPARWTQFVAGPKAGKSSLTMFMAIELSEGRDPLDGSPIDPVTVLYCDGEMGRDDLEELIRACGHDPVKLTNLHSTNERMRLDTVKGAGRLLRLVDKLGAKAVLLDGLNGFVNPEASENTDNTWRPFVDNTIDHLKHRRVAVVSNDNMGKDQNKGARGSSVKTDKADGVIALKRTDTGIRLRPTHSRGGAYITADLDLDAEGFDRSRPIRYRRSSWGWPAGTKVVAALLDSLGVPLGDGRRKVRARLNAEVVAAEAKGLDADRFRVANDALAGAIRYRKTAVIRPTP
jgi:AAA domain